MCQTMHYLIYSPNLTSLERLHTLVDMYASNMATSIADSGHLYAMMSSASSLSPAAQLSETSSGTTRVYIYSCTFMGWLLMLCCTICTLCDASCVHLQVEYLRGLASNDDLTDVSNSLGLIAKHFVNHLQLK